MGLVLSSPLKNAQYAKKKKKKKNEAGILIWSESGCKHCVDTLRKHEQNNSGVWRAQRCSSFTDFRWNWRSV